jgi:hypothetical protein
MANAEIIISPTMIQFSPKTCTAAPLPFDPLNQADVDGTVSISNRPMSRVESRPANHSPGRLKALCMVSQSPHNFGTIVPECTPPSRTGTSSAYSIQLAEIDNRT